jgi:hypothetical protein
MNQQTSPDTNLRSDGRLSKGETRLQTRIGQMRLVSLNAGGYERVQATGQVEDSSSGPPVHHDLQKYVGGAIFVGVVVGTLLLWLVLRPAGQPDRRYTG